jgi:hypothetical protein
MSGGAPQRLWLPQSAWWPDSIPSAGRGRRIAPTQIKKKGQPESQPGSLGEDA